jgi:hypothetical protein
MEWGSHKAASQLGRSSDASSWAQVQTALRTCFVALDKELLWRWVITIHVLRDIKAEEC